MKYRKKPLEVDAIQWFKNGDHPDDNSVMVYPDGNSTTQFEPFLSEGKIVRRYRRPLDESASLQPPRICSTCNRNYDDHGWIDTLEGGHKVCPGDWIIKGIAGEYYPCKPDIFEKTYEKVEEI